MPEIPTFTASKWTPLEVSLVNVAADPAARIRSEPLDLRDTAALASPGSGALGERERITRIGRAYAGRSGPPAALAQRLSTKASRQTLRSPRCLSRHPSGRSAARIVHIGF